jgi:hypothetical protein
MCLIELIECTKDAGKPVQSFIYDLLAQTLFENNLFSLLHQLININVIPDSISLATLLTGTGPGTVNFDLSLEMFKRMKSHADVLSLLTTTGNLLEAAVYAKKTNTIALLSAVDFLESAIQTGNKTLFLNVYRFLEENGMISLHNNQQSNRHRNSIGRFVSIYRELWGPEIEMEQL